MNPHVWSATTYDVMGLRSPGGDRFTRFVDTLIRGVARRYGIPDTAVRTNQRTNIADGGVDTEVAQAVAEATGRFLVPTCWQYKAQGYADISDSKLQAEVHGSYVVDCVKRGFGYRLAIADDMPPTKKQDWETVLNKELRAIARRAKPAMVVSASDLASWATAFPGIVIEFFKPAIANVLHLKAWGKNATASTPTFVDVASWADIEERLRAHLNFGAPVADVVCPVCGDAGVGKTRMVYEVVAALPGSETLVLYLADDTRSIEIASYLASDVNASAVLIVDECALEQQAALRRTLEGHRDRIRVITIDNFNQRAARYSPELRLDQMPKGVVEDILRRNFPQVPADRRRSYSDLSAGFVHIAADLCRFDPQIQQSGSLNPGLGRIDEYFEVRLKGHHTVIEALALVRRVGFRDDVTGELDDLCDLTGLKRNELFASASNLKDATGFVARAGRYLYVTPEIIARVAFDRAWSRWANGDPREFLRRFPPSLLQSFLERVSQSGSEEVRGVVATFFREWATRLRPDDLTDSDVVDYFVTLADTEPETFLPILRRIAGVASHDQLLQISGRGGRRWGPRRHLVWLAERMAPFPEFLSDCEDILFRLATAESEPGIANNATAIWQRLCRVFMSGTAVPFAQRISILEGRCTKSAGPGRALALSALPHILDQHVTRMVGPSVVAGRIPPEEWNPRSISEYRECADTTLKMLERFANDDDDELRRRAVAVAIECLHIFCRLGCLDRLKTFLTPDRLSEEQLVGLFGQLEDFLEHECSQQSGPASRQELCDELDVWRRGLQPQDIHGRLLTLVAKSPWKHGRHGQERGWKDEFGRLASDLLSSEGALAAELPWLTSPSAESAVFLGSEIGRLDAGAAHLREILTFTATSRVTGLARGYLQALADAHPEHRENIDALLDEFQNQAPDVIFDLAISDGESRIARERAVQLIDSGKVPPEWLRAFLLGPPRQSMSLDEFNAMLKRLVRAAEDGNRATIEAGISALGFKVGDERDAGRPPIFGHPETRDLAWRLLELAATNEGREAHWWGEVAENLVDVDPPRALQLACRAIVSEGMQIRDVAKGLLNKVAQRYPEDTMHAVGAAMLDAETGWHFYVDKITETIGALPPAIVKQWLEANGLEAARKVARHLEPPFLDAEGKPVVPDLTAFVLSQFEDDDPTFHEFCAGVHSFEFMSGDIAAHYENHADTAARFRNHQIRRVAQWAELEMASARTEAAAWRQRDEEEELL